MTTQSRAAPGAVTALPAARMAATMQPATLNREARTVDVTWTAGGLVRRFDPASGFQFWEELSADPQHVRMGRLTGGASVLDTHIRASVRQILGTVERASLADGAGVATLRFSRRPDADAVFGDVADGIVRHVSVGYVVHHFMDTGRTVDGVPVFLAVDWEPNEISMVPVPADAGCSVRAAPDGDASALHPVTVESATMTVPAPAPATPPAPAPTPVPAPASAPAVSPPAPAPAAAPAPAPVPGDDAARALMPPGLMPPAGDLALAERQRGIDIRAAVRAAAPMAPEIFGDAYADQLVSSGCTVDAARGAVITAMATVGARALGGSAPAPSMSPTIQLGTDHADPAALRSRMVDAIAARALDVMGYGAAMPMPEASRQFSGFSVLELGAELAAARGERFGRQLPAVLYERLTERSHATGDFPLLLSAASNKVLVAAWQAASPTYRKVFGKKTFKDFKPHHFIRVGDFPVPLEIGETAEYQYGTISESAESVVLGSFGRILRLSRRMIINDDLGGFGDLTAKAGQRTILWENGVAWGLLAQNGGRGPMMSDNKPLFHVDHGNIGTGAEIDVASVGAAYAAMMLQKSLDGQRLNITPSLLLTGALGATKALQFTTVNTSPTTPAETNPYAGRLTPLADGELHELHPAWWMFATPGMGNETLVYGGLEGLDGPRVTTAEGFKTDGLDIKLAYDFGVGAIDYRGAYLNPGP